MTFLLTVLWKKKMNLHEEGAVFGSVVEGEVIF